MRGGIPGPVGNHHDEAWLKRAETDEILRKPVESESRRSTIVKDGLAIKAGSGVAGRQNESSLQAVRSCIRC